ncbi:MAG: c-type cytochrome [Planctomycetaceae bacterium]|jgi:DNA-binding beta-propeller fold protein YncE/mono/diheme cytochrome c family protein|nr:c-type cytochrome [Planctomycetaceae bacterium]
MKNLINKNIVKDLLISAVGFLIGSIFVFFLLNDNFNDSNSEPFNSADQNKDGVISKNEFKKVLIQQARNNNKKLKKVPNSNISSPTVPFISFNSADKNNDGNIDKKEFRQILAANYKNGQFINPPILQSNQNNQHDNCPIPDMPPDVCPDSGFVRQGGNKSVMQKSPTALAAIREGTIVLVSLRDINSVGVIDTLQNKFVRYIPVGNLPHGITVSQDEKYLYVTSGEYYGQVQIIDIDSGTILKESQAGHTPVGITITPDGQRLFVCNRFSGDVYEYTLPTLSILRRIKVIREPTAIAVSPDGKRIFVANSQPNGLNNYPDQPDKKPDVAAEISIINTENGETENLRLPKGSCNINGICVAQNGNYVYLTHLISQYWNSTDKLDSGQMNINAISFINLKELTEKNNRQLITITLDDQELGAANPYGITTNEQQIFITTAGTDELIVIDKELLHKKINETITNDLSTNLSTNFSINLSANFTFLNGIKRRIKLSGKGARSIVSAGQKVFVGLFFSDTIQRLDFNDCSEISLSEISIGKKTDELSLQRAGEMYWNDAALCYQQWQSCASCHPDARITAMNWDLLHDGADNPKNTKSLILSHQTPPTMWLGDRRHAMQCTRTGFRFIMFQTPLREPCFAIDEYIKTLKPVMSPYLADGKLSAKAERGKKLFNDKKTGCNSCHSGQYFTDLKMYDVGSEDQYCNQKLFDTPTLIEVWRTAPYMHDGRYKSIKDVLKKGKHGKENGNLEQLTDSQLDDLAEYVLSL